MKPMIRLSTFVLFAVTLTACVTPSPSTSVSSELSMPSIDHSLPPLSSEEGPNDSIMLDFYNLNDFHGSLAYNPNADEIGINRLAHYFKQRLQDNANSVFVSSGDMWQGSADSNITRGRLVVDAMNEIGFDAMAIGNHEFDWMDTTIYDLAERSEFPLLGINILDKRTGQRAGFAQPYTMIQRLGIRIGIIGTIGPSLESSILQSAVEHYNFVPYGNLVQDAAQFLRDEGAKLVILLNHDGSVDSSILPYVDAVFNGHTHRYDMSMIQGTPVFQALSNGKAVAHARFYYDHGSDSVTYMPTMSGVYTFETLMEQGLISVEDAAMKTMYDYYLETEINTVKNEVLGTAVGSFSTSQLGRLAVDSMLTYGRGVDDAVVASFHNFGGVRASIAAGTVTYGDVYKSFPFDNELIIAEVTGTELQWWMAQNLHMKTIPNLGTIQTNRTYKIISINYLTEKHWADVSDYPHNELTINNTFEYVRELLKTRWLNEGTLRASDY